MAPKGKALAVSKTKRANHLKQKKTFKAGAKVSTFGKRSHQNSVNGRHNAKSETNFNGKHASNKSSFGKKSRVGKKPAAKSELAEDEIDADDILDMMDEDDISFLKSKTFGSKNTQDEGDSPSNNRKRQYQSIEDQYDDELHEQESSRKKTKELLPIKTKKGIIERTVEVDSDSEEEEQHSEEMSVEEEPEEEEPQTAAEMYARRKQKIEDLKTLIGTSSSNILESPEERLDSISAILKLYNQLTPDIFITGFKLISASLVELFKDLVPGFEIKDTTKPGDKLKKATREVKSNEEKLLKYYQIFLTRLEESFAPLKSGKKPGKDVDETKKRVGLFAVKCLSDLLVAMPHFNFSKNIVHALIPLTANRDDDVRLLVCDAFKKLFKEDKHGEISLHAVRQVNHLIKNKRNHQIHPDCLDIFMALRIKDINLDKEKEEEISRYKTLTRKQKLLILSKSERRRRKKIERIQKEIVAAKAEQNKGSKTKFQTEVVKIVFTIYFRILKTAPKSILMGVVLQGLAKFAHTINVDFFADLVEVFNNLIANEQLDYKQCLFAIQVVLVMLSGQGDALNIDPIHFYSHLYKVLFQLTAGPSNANVPIALDCLDNMLIKRRKKVSIHRVLAFTKRVATLALQVQHNSGIALMNFVRILMMTHKQTDILLDLEATSGNGSFMPELEEPEHCNAGSTSLWELHSLARHYHPVVERFARHILLKSPTAGNGALPIEFTRKSPQELHSEYDSTTLEFKPAVPKYSSAPVNWKKMNPEEIHDTEFEEQLNEILAKDYVKLWDATVNSKTVTESRK